jgi:predicted N-acyltransferase
VWIKYLKNIFFQRLFKKYSKNILGIFPKSNHKKIKKQVGVACVILFAPIGILYGAKWGC